PALVRWTGSGWSVVGDRPDLRVRDVASYNGSLVAAVETFEDSPGGGYWTHGRLYRVSGSDWLPLSRQLDAVIATIAPFDHSLYCGGPFIAVGDKSALGIARWDGTTPTAVPDVRDMSAAPVTTLDPIPVARRGEVVRIGYTIATASHTSLALYDVRGRLVRSLASAVTPPGSFAISWDGRDATGAQVAAGVYFVRLHTTSADRVRRIVLSR